MITTFFNQLNVIDNVTGIVIGSLICSIYKQNMWKTFLGWIKLFQNFIKNLIVIVV